MVELATTDDYLALVPPLHRPRARFIEMLTVATAPLVAAQHFLNHLPVDFDLDTAIGSQLDIVGQWVGRSRFVAAPVPNVYFTWDHARLGWDAGYWKGPYDDDAGLTRLDDATYRVILRAKIAANQWDGTVEGAFAALAPVYAETGSRLFVQDNYDMSMTFGLSGVIPPPVYLSLFSADYIPLKPAGVKVDYRVVSVSDTPMFGWDMDNEFVTGWDAGSWGVPPEILLTD